VSVIKQRPVHIASASAATKTTPAESAVALVMFVVAGGLAIVFINSGFASVSAAFQVFAALVTGEDVWSQLSLEQFAINVLCGLIGGLVIGSLRYSRYQGRLVEELVEAIGDRTAVQAWDIGVAFVLIHVAISVLVGLLLTLIGFAPWPVHPLEPMPWVGGLTPIGLALGGGGGPEPSGWVLTGLLVLIIVIGGIVSGAVIGLFACAVSGATLTLSSGAAGAIAGGQSAIGRVFGVALVLAMGRVWTARVLRRRDPVEPPLTIDLLRLRYQHGHDRSDPFWRFDHFCQERGVSLSLVNFENELRQFSANVAARKAGALPRVLQQAGDDCSHERWRLEKLREPYLAFPEDTPALEPTKASLLYSGWTKDSLFHTVLTGTAFGSLYSSLVVVVSSVVYLFQNN